MRSLLALLAAMALYRPSLSASETVADETHGFRLTLPKGFVPNDDLASAAPNILHAFVKGDPSDEEPDLILFIEKMRGTIGPQRLKPEYAPRGFKGRLFTTKWQGFEVDAFEVPELLGEVEMVTYNVQIPLKRVAIQIKLFGPVSRKSEIEADLKQILAALHGESNWLPGISHLAAKTAPENYGKILLGFAIAFIVGGLVVLLYRLSNCPKRNSPGDRCGDLSGELVHAADSRARNRPVNGGDAPSGFRRWDIGYCRFNAEAECTNGLGIRRTTPDGRNLE